MTSAIQTRWGSGTALLPGGTRHGSTRADRSYQSRMRAANSCRVSMVSEVWTLTPRLWHGGAHGESRERRDARPQGEGEEGGEEKGARAGRSEERRVGKAGVSTCRRRG